MKKLILSVVVMFGLLMSVSAQNNNLKEYVGKFVFEPGSPVAEVTFTAEDSSLVLNSAMGSTPIEKKGVDTFYLAAYDGLIVFKRNATTKSVEAVAVIVQGMELVGKKDTAVALKEDDFYSSIWADKAR